MIIGPDDPETPPPDMPGWVLLIVFAGLVFLVAVITVHHH